MDIALTVLDTGPLTFLLWKPHILRKNKDTYFKRVGFKNCHLSEAAQRVGVLDELRVVIVQQVRGTQRNMLLQSIYPFLCLLWQWKSKKNVYLNSELSPLLVFCELESQSHWSDKARAILCGSRIGPSDARCFVFCCNFFPVL